MPAGSNIDATKPSSDQQLPSVPLTAHTTTLAADFPLSGDRARKIQRDYAVATGLPMTTFLNIDALNSIQFALIPPGRFLTSSTNESSSSAQPSQHRITISHAIYLATTPITVAQFSAFIKQTNFRTKAEQTGAAFTLINNAWHVTPGASWREPGFDQSPDDPVVEITWPDAVAFCEWISITSGRHVRLPTSAEWEYACRSGTATRFYVGDSWAELEKAAWCLPNSLERTHPVAQKIPNAWGLYDMHGNASQWCQDWFGAAPSADAVDPTGPATGDQRIKRGGSWLDNFVGTSSSSVACNHPNTADSVEGFRILLEVPSFAGSH
jgi:formylglycine-generating enzyme required for sulfatase activity